VPSGLNNNPQLLLVALDASNSTVSTDSPSCDSGATGGYVNWLNTTAGSPEAVLFDSNANGCGAAVTVGFEGVFTTTPAACVAPVAGLPMITSTTFIYQ